MSVFERLQAWFRVPPVNGLALSAGLGFGVLPGLLLLGGLAPVVAVGLAGAAAAVLAQRELGQQGTAPWARTLADGLVTMIPAALLAPWVRELGWLGVAMGLAIWAGLAWLRPGLRGGSGLLLLLASGAWLMGLGAPVVWEPGWTLLDPRWGAWRSWLGPAVALGVLLPLALLGHWDRHQVRSLTERRHPWVLLGGTLLAWLALALIWGRQWELAPLGAEAPTAGPLALLVGAAGAAVALGRHGERASGWALWGAFSTLWMAGPAFEALEAWWSTLLPLGVAALAAEHAWRSQGSERGLPAGIATVAFLAAWAAWPGFPASALAAAAFALLPVVLFWMGATRALKEAPA